MSHNIIDPDSELKWRQYAKLQHDMSDTLSSLKEYHNKARVRVASWTESPIARTMNAILPGTEVQVCLRRFIREHEWVPSDDFIVKKYREWDKSNWDLMGYPETPEGAVWITGTLNRERDPINYNDELVAVVNVVEEVYVRAISAYVRHHEYTLYPFQIADIRIPDMETW
jgi:hypothetical protein